VFVKETGNDQRAKISTSSVVVGIFRRVGNLTRRTAPMKSEPKREQPPGGNPVAVETAQHKPNDTSTLPREQQERNRKYAEAFPLKRGFIVGNLILVPCNYCASIHTHGWDPKHGSETEELRYAHCCNGPTSYRISPFRQRHLALVDSRAENILGINLPLTELARASRARAAGERIQTSLKSELRTEFRTEQKNRRLKKEAHLRAEREVQRARDKVLREKWKDMDKAARKTGKEGQTHGN
jgi:hypothetical protein